MTRKQHLITEEVCKVIAYLSLVSSIILFWLYSLADFTKVIPRNLFIVSVIVLLISTACYWVSRLVREFKY